MLFGGYEPDRYDGELAILPLLPGGFPLDSPDTISDWRVNVTSFSLRLPNETIALTNESFHMDGILDSGCPYLDVPNDKLFKLIGSQYEKSLQWTPCEMKDLNASLDIGFGETTISVPFHNLIGPGYDLAEDKPVRMTNGTEGCSFRLSGTGLDYEEDWSELMLGGPFLQSAYVVHHADQLLVGLAQSRAGSSRSSAKKGGTIVPLRAGDTSWQRGTQVQARS
jgi:hypothetical protein